MAEQRLPRATRVKNKQPSDRQITAEQILREAKEIQLEDDFKAPKTIITDPEELNEYRLKKRKEYEDMVRRVGRFNMGIWVKYATWEEQQKDFRRARSVWERALAIDYRNVSVWLKYAEMEMRHRFVNHARNVWDRAVSLLPRIDQLWYKYIHMEEMLGNVPGARQVFERWMRFEPDHAGWMAYVKFELRYNEVDRARAIFERYVQILPTIKSWVRYAKFEMKNGEVALARKCYERAVDDLGEDAQTEDFFIAFAEFEEKVKEVERARAIYKYALDHIPKGQAPALYERFTLFEKQHGDREGIESVVISKRRFQYEEEVSRNPLNYDSWFDYIKLEESGGELERVRDVYERAVAQLPPGNEKRFWRRYIYMWIKYALFEELDVGDVERARDVYRAALSLIPHKLFTFAKVWILAAKFEIRQKQVGAARRLLGQALGQCPKDKVFRAYIDLELSMGNIDRCRKLYEKYLEFNPANVGAWVKWADLERSLGEADRARALYELAISQPALDMPEALWKSYIDFEIGEGDRQRVRVLYDRLLDRTKHVKVWLSYARFEATPLAQAEGAEGQDGPSTSTAPGDPDDPESPMACATRARGVYSRAFRTLRELTPDNKAEAVMILEAWRDFEAGLPFVTNAERVSALEAVSKKMPRRVKRKRAVRTDDGHVLGMEEYYDYVFPEETAAAPGLKLLEAAYKWKRMRTAGPEDGDAGPSAEQQQQQQQEPQSEGANDGDDDTIMHVQRPPAGGNSDDGDDDRQQQDDDDNGDRHARDRGDGLEGDGQQEQQRGRKRGNSSDDDGGGHGNGNDVPPGAADEPIDDY